MLEAEDPLKEAGEFAAQAQAWTQTHHPELQEGVALRRLVERTGIGRSRDRVPPLGLEAMSALLEADASCYGDHR